MHSKTGWSKIIKVPKEIIKYQLFICSSVQFIGHTHCLRDDAFFDIKTVRVIKETAENILGRCDPKPLYFKILRAAQNH